MTLSIFRAICLGPKSSPTMARPGEGRMVHGLIIGMALIRYVKWYDSLAVISTVVVVALLFLIPREILLRAKIFRVITGCTFLYEKENCICAWLCAVMMRFGDFPASTHLSGVCFSRWLPI